MTKKILLAMASDIMRTAYSDILKNEGFDIIKTESGTEAYDMAIKEKPAVVLAEANLDDLSGFALLKKIRENENIKRTPVMIFSQYESKEEKQKAIDNEANSFLAFASVPPMEVINRVKILIGEQKSYYLPVSVNAKEVKALASDMGIGELVCPKCNSEKKLVLIKDLSNGNERFIVSFVCPNNCNI